MKKQTSKVRKGKYKGEHGGAQVGSQKPREHVSALQVLLKSMERGKQGNSHLIIND
jgi:hypothetical protein